MDFYEALKERAWFKLRRGKDLGEYNEVIEKLAIGPRNGVIATIEALKEMMVGEPMENQIRHDEGWEYHGHPILDPSNRSVIPITILENEVMVYEGGYIRADGEGVVVMVFRVGTGKEEEG